MDWSSALGHTVGGIFGVMGAKKGAAADYRYGLKREAELWRRAQERGLTPQEYYGSSAPGGAASGSYGQSQVMGNAMQQSSAAVAEQVFQADQNQQNRDTQKDVAKTQADAQVKVAEIKAGTDIRGQDLTAQVSREKLAQVIRQHEEIGLQQLAKDLRMSESELKLRAQELITKSPQFLREMKRLGMGTENMFVEVVLRSMGIDDFDQIPNLSKAKQKELMQRMLSGSSSLAKTLAQTYGMGDEFMEAISEVHDFIMNWMPTMKGVSVTSKNKTGAVLGGSSSSEPHQTAPNMNVR